MEPAECASMADVRQSIDSLDAELVKLLARRAAYIDRAAELKAGIGWPARIPERVEEVVDNVTRLAQQEGLDPALAEEIWRRLIDWSIRREDEAMGMESGE